MAEVPRLAEPPNAAAALLGIIAGRETDGFYEIRYGWTPTHHQWGGVNEDRSGVARRIAELGSQPRTNVWVGAALRTARTTGRESVKRIWCLWADVDVDKQPDAMERLHSFPHVPTMVVLSGSVGHAHAWWSLVDPISADVATSALARLSFHLGADKGATDLARVMRVPGTTHHKPGHSAPVEVAYHDPRAYSIWQLVGGLPDPSERAVAPRPSRTRGDGDVLRSIATADYAYRLTGLRPNGRRKIRCPFHADGAERTPSLHLYDTTWTCFGCRKGGDIYNFAAWLWLGQRNADGDSFRESPDVSVGRVTGVVAGIGERV